VNEHPRSTLWTFDVEFGGSLIFVQEYFTSAGKGPAVLDQEGVLRDVKMMMENVI